MRAARIPARGSGAALPQACGLPGLYPAGARAAPQAQQARRVAPLFPAYGFIAIVNGQYHSARWTIGVTALIMDGVAPAKVPDQVIDEIRRREVRGAVELPKAPGMNAGAR